MFIDPEAIHAYDHTTDTTTDHYDDMGAQAPTLALRLRPTKEKKIELYRPRNAARIALRPDSNILTAIRKHCLDEGITLTYWFERAALAHLKKHDRDPHTMGALAPQIDMIDLKESLNLSSIREAFHFWCGAFNNLTTSTAIPWRPTWTDRDRLQALKFEDYDARLVEIGIMTVIANRTIGGQRIKSFAYFCEQIAVDAPNWAALDSDTIDLRLLSGRRNLAKRLGIAPPVPEKRLAKMQKMLEG